MIYQEFPPARKEELDSASASMPGPPLESGSVGSWGKAGHQLHSYSPFVSGHRSARSDEDHTPLCVMTIWRGALIAPPASRVLSASTPAPVRFSSPSHGFQGNI